MADLQNVMDQLMSLKMVENIGQALTVAVLSDEFIFEFIPRTQRNMHQTTLAIIDHTPETIEAAGYASREAGKAVYEVSKAGTLPLKTILDKIDLVSLIGLA